MSPEALKAYTSLSNSHQTDGSGPLTGILRTNGFDVGVRDPGAEHGEGAYSCVGAVGSRFNHRCACCKRVLVHCLTLHPSCSPSAVHHFSIPSFSMEILAVRPIAKGEEITVTYTPLAAGAAERQVGLKPYGFTCTCPACMDPETSDKERGRARSSLLPKTSQGVKHAEAALAAYEATGLQCLSRYTELLCRVAQINRKKGHKERADTLESMADKVIVAQEGRGKQKVVKSATPIKSFTFGSSEELMKFIAEHGDATERASMLNAFKQVMNPDLLRSTKVTGSDGKEITVHMSDPVPRPKGL